MTWLRAIRSAGMSGGVMGSPSHGVWGVVRIWRSRSEASWLDTPRRARSVSRVMGWPWVSWCSAATRRAKSSSAAAGLVSGWAAGLWGEGGWPGTRGTVRCRASWTAGTGTGRLSPARIGGTAGPVVRRSSMETATRNAAAGVAAVMRPQAVGWAWSRLAARLSRTPPARTRTGQDRRPAARPVRLSRWRSRAAMTQVRSMQTAMAQAIGPRWPCWAAVSRMWTNDPAPAITARITTGRESMICAARWRPGFTGCLLSPGCGHAWVGTWRAGHAADVGGWVRRLRRDCRRGRPLSSRPVRPGRSR